MTSSVYPLDLHSAGSQPPQIKALTSLRIFAAMHVVLFHWARPLWSQAVSQWIAQSAGSSAPVRMAVSILGRATVNILSTGAWSVSLFFILSGFILTYNYHDKISRPGGMRSFWVARLARIYPVYLLGWSLQAPLMVYAFAHVKMFSRSEVLRQGALSLLLLQNWLPRYALTWNLPAWSLGVEAFFYLLFPLLMIHVVQRGRSTGALTGIIVACSAISVALMTTLWALTTRRAPLDQESPRFVFLFNLFMFMPVFRIPEFIAGMALGRMAILRGKSVVPRRPSAVALVALGLILLIEANSDERPAIICAGAMTPLFALLIWTLATPRAWLGRIVAWSPLVLLGEASYAVYICHWPLFTWFARAMALVWPRGFGPGNAPTGFGVLLFMIIALLAFCIAVFLLLETPARNKIRRALDPRPHGRSTTVGSINAGP